MKNNIVLIGMPAVGKSTVGVILAKILGYSFIDSDIVIQEKENRLLKDIIADEGVDGFIAVEDRINSSINAERAVIATGGSAVYGENAMKHFSETSIIVYLSIDFDTLSKRLSNIHNRGVVIRENQTLSDLYNERVPLYEKYADIVICEDNLTIEQTVQNILEKINNISC